MFTIENWEEGFIWVDFQEHPYKDIRKEEVGLFDVSTKAYPNYAPDFMKGKSFDQKCYCICLLRTTLDLSKDEMVKFLEHQCDKMEEPLKWLDKFEELLYIADEFNPIKSNKIRFKMLNILISDQYQDIINIINKSPHSIKKKIDNTKVGEIIRMNVSDRRSFFEQVRDANQEDYLMKLVNILLVDLGKKVSTSEKEQPRRIFRGTAKQLARGFNEIRKLKNKKGESVTSIDISKEARWLCAHYRYENGKLFTFGTMQKYLTTLKNNKEIL